LFADVLRARLRQVTPAVIPELHHRASAWYEEHQWIAEAMEHAIAGQDWERAARLLIRHGWLLLLISRFFYPKS
jgi:LuxR family transcriptional regulator, maltose regulon positive regulatory protein